ncbi:prepronociceptin isoform X3 [Fukomys damarensis]|uniref:prepronociceptin isoform X3 n=1 Tax=Fukomys damarensis TaxID=885580 RepID=UPI001455902D|nr:prepronociceptin isoform X3 [Fukomys damarensis]
MEPPIPGSPRRTASTQHLAPCPCTMKILLYDLLLLSLLSSVSGSCPRDCLTCREKLRPAPDSFNLELCILQCEEKVFPSPLWTPCTKILARGSWQLRPADPEHVVAALYQPRASEMQHLKRMPRVQSPFQDQEETEPGTEDAGEVEQKQLQKRFGGFTGARKSARKLANQKRFSEFMRHYLVLSMQSSQRRRTLHQNAPHPSKTAVALLIFLQGLSIYTLTFGATLRGETALSALCRFRLLYRSRCKALGGHLETLTSSFG